MGLCRLGLGGGLPSLSAYLGWGRCGLRGVGSSEVGVGEGAGTLFLLSLRDSLGSGRLPAWGVLARGGAPVVVLLVGVRRLGLGGGLLSLLAGLCWGRSMLRRSCLGVPSKYASPRNVLCRGRLGAVWFFCLRTLVCGRVLPFWTRASYFLSVVSLGA